MDSEWETLSGRKRKAVTYNEDDLERSSKELDGEPSDTSSEEDSVVVDTKNKDDVSVVCALKRQPPQACGDLEV